MDIGNDFVHSLLLDDRKAMNAYMKLVALNTFSYFDTGKRPSGGELERFYHGFVLGLIVDLQKRYVITSNRESGFGRYDVMLHFYLLDMLPEEGGLTIREIVNELEENYLAVLQHRHMHRQTV